MNKMQEQVQVFHQAMEQPIRTTPSSLPAAERALRANLIYEETLEVIGALGLHTVEDGNDSLSAPGQPEPVLEQIKELCDLLYVIFGTAVQMGVDLQAFFDAVHENNMTKATGPVRPDGKRLKPEGYTAVDLKPVMDWELVACQTCYNVRRTGEMAPPHFASVRCESGQHNHCSCDTCF